MEIRYPYSGLGAAGFKTDSIPREALASMLFSMTRIRRIEERIASEYSKDEIKNPVHLVIGQEATCVGLATAMERDDLLYLTHRTHGGYLAKGGNLNAMMAELYCKATGCAGSRGGSMHLIDHAVGVAGSSAIVGGAIPIAAGAALSFQLKNERKVAAVLFGDAANEAGVTSETLNFAVLKKLPLIFFCENNFYSVQSPLHFRQPITRMHERARGFGIAVETCDGSNVVDVHQTCRRAIEYARSGNGPVFIEAPVYRWLAHAGDKDDSATGYRQIAEREHWKESACPIKLFSDHLLAEKVVDQGWFSDAESKIRTEIDAAFQFAKDSPIPTAEDLKRHAYALG